MPKTGQSFTLLEGDHKKIIFNVTGFDVTTAQEIHWYAGDIEKDKTNMTITEDTITFDLFSSETVGKVGRIEHELKIIDDLGNVSTIATGTMKVLAPLKVLGN